MCYEYVYNKSEPRKVSTVTWFAVIVFMVYFL